MPQVSCPYCQTPVPFAVGQAGELRACPSCGAEVEAPVWVGYPESLRERPASVLPGTKRTPRVLALLVTGFGILLVCLGIFRLWYGAVWISDPKRVFSWVFSGVMVLVLGLVSIGFGRLFGAGKKADIEDEPKMDS